MVSSPLGMAYLGVAAQQLSCLKSGFWSGLAGQCASGQTSPFNSDGLTGCLQFEQAENKPVVIGYR